MGRRHACRPSRKRSRMNSYAPSRFSSPTTQVRTGRRPAGSSRIEVVSRSPYAVRESVRGIGVAVMCSTCGAASPGPFASSDARCETPKRCCSSTTQTARLANLTSGSIRACVPTTSPSSPDASRSSASRRRRAGVADVSSTNGIGSPASSRSSVAACCSASVSVGAISAAWWPASSARNIAWTATTVL